MRRRAASRASLCVAIALTARAQTVAIKAGRLVDPETGTVSTQQVILVEGSRIKAAGASLSIPPGTPVIDLSSATVLPGLMDAHTHMCLVVPKPRSPGFEAALEAVLTTAVFRTTGFRALEGAANARGMLEAGFTTIRDLGNAGNYADTDLRRAIEEDLVPGPTMITAGRIITPYGGQYSRLTPERRDIGSPEYLYADTLDELKKGIRENIQYGAGVIKLAVDDQPYIYSAEELRFAVREAARAGLKVAAHCMTEAGARNAAQAGVASIEHGWRMTDEILALAKKNQVALAGTEHPEFLLADAGVSVEEHAAYIDRLRRAYRAGVAIVYGTDVFFALPGQTRGTLAISYVESFVKAGLPPKAILQALTTNAARLLGVDKERGAIKPGFAADLIATAGNPMEDAMALKQVRFVMKGGRVVYRR
ncbi:MAG: amidohydrolase family protein [Candidatus Solibacter usitatus]|nr:amidohydrolase family protein [Candidatus Solibacter usitatus]